MFSLRRFLIFVVLLGLTAVIGVRPVQAMTDRYVNVATGSDAGNDCTDWTNPCATLAHALGQASSGDTIHLAAGNYTADNLVLDMEIRIIGSGKNATFIDPGVNGRHFTVTPNAVRVRLEKLAVQNGSNGAIQVDGATELSLRHAKIVSNSGPLGAITLLEGATLTAVRTGLNDNESSSDGGAIHCDQCSHITIFASNVTENHALDNGGAIARLNPGLEPLATGGDTKIIASTVIGNGADMGGAIYIESLDSLTISESTLADNGATLLHGGGVFGNGDITVRRSTFLANVTNPNNGWGGAIGTAGNSIGQLTAVNSTFSGNSAAHGGAIHIAANVTADLANNTFIGNTSTVVAGTIGGTGTLDLNNTILTDSAGGDCSAFLAPTGHHNLIDDPTCGATGGLPFNLGAVTNLDPTLQDNGGPTETHQLLAGSNALDAGFNSCPHPNTGTPLQVDQRGDGYWRPYDGDGDAIATCDIGAYEKFGILANPQDVELGKHLLIPTVNGVEAVLEGEAIAGGRIHLQLAVTNASDQPINFLAGDLNEPIITGLRQSAMPHERCELQTSEMQVTTTGAPTHRINPTAFGDESSLSFAAMVLELPPDETWQADITVPVATNMMGCMLTGAMEVYAATAVPIPGSCNPNHRPECHYLGWTPRARNIEQIITELEPLASDPTIMHMVWPDSADEPDHLTNHFAAPMSAYGGVPALFPTVYDLSTGLPPGPRHRYAWPLHLGPMVSPEWPDADFGFNRNIIPLLNIANLDNFDDGVGPITFNQCQPSAIPVQVTIRPAAVHYFAEKDSTAYLNVWVDGNFDGSYDDVANCGGNTVVEHILRNQPVDVVALGAGSFNLSFMSQPVPWPANQPQRPPWLRVTLSDSPAPTPFTVGGISFGDGRGPALGYVLGETESRRWPHYSGDVDGPDAAVQIDGRIRTVQQPEGAHISHVLKVDYGNAGDAVARNTLLTIIPDPLLSTDGLEVDIATRPHLPPSHIQEICPTNGGCYFEIDLGHLPPGRHGTVLLRHRGAVCNDGTPATFCSATALTSQTHITADEDTNPDNDSDEITLNFNIGMPPTIIWPGNSTVNSGDFILQGIGEPQTTVSIFTDGFESGNTVVGNDGTWTFGYTSLDEGLHEIAVAEADNGRSPAMMNAGSPTALVINLSLGWNPATFQMKRGDGPFHGIYNHDGRRDSHGWRIPYQDGDDIILRLEVACTEEAEVSLSSRDTLVSQLSDPDGDDVYEGTFTGDSGLADQIAFLDITCAGETSTYLGRFVENPGNTVIDAITGDPIEGATITILQKIDVWEHAWLVWPASAYGQDNPVITDENGQFDLPLPPGIYGLRVEADGYQPRHSEPMSLQGIFPSRTIALEPSSTTTPNHSVTLLADGFSTPSLTIRQGESVAWHNSDLGEHSVMSEEAIGRSTFMATAVDSGTLLAGDTFSTRFDTPGTYTITDSENPLASMTIIVEQAQIFLPLIQN